MLVAVLMLGMVVLFGWLLIRNVRMIRRADAQGAAGQPRVGSSPAAQPLLAAGLEQRLLELDDLHRRGVITQAERQEARQRVLSGS